MNTRNILIANFAGILVLFGLFIVTEKASAHPGNTDASGGHYCWTNCDSWGYSYGEYHYHGTPSYSPPSYSIPTYTPSVTIKPFAVYKVFGYSKVILVDSSENIYLVTYGYGCSSSTFYEGQIIYIDTYYSPGFYDNIYTSTYESSKKCSISGSEELELKSYFVSAVIDSKDEIIVTDSYGDSYLIEYGIGCLSMWRYEGKVIQIDTGLFLDGIGDRIYLFDSDDDCSVWDVNKISSPTYVPSPVPTPDPSPTPPTNTGLQPIVTLVFDKGLINKGESVTLTWTSINGTLISSNFNALTASGSAIVKPEITTTYTVTVTNEPAGKSDTKSVIISVNQPSVLGAVTGNHPNGTVILGTDNRTVYVISNGVRKGFATPEEYNSHGYNFSEIVSANSTDLSLPEGSVMPFLDGTLVLDTSDGRTIYIINSGKKRGFTSPEVFNGLGYKYSQAVKGNLSLYQTGEPIGSATAPHPEGALIKIGTGLFKITSGGKQAIKTMSIFNSWKWSMDRVMTANEADKNLPDVAILPYRDGTILKDHNSVFYIISNGVARAFPSIEVFNSLGYKMNNVNSLTETDFNNVIIGGTL